MIPHVVAHRLRCAANGPRTSGAGRARVIGTGDADSSNFRSGLNDSGHLHRVRIVMLVAVDVGTDGRYVHITGRKFYFGPHKHMLLCDGEPHLPLAVDEQFHPGAIGISLDGEDPSRTGVVRPFTDVHERLGCPLGFIIKIGIFFILRS
jgi:hypothetical protein